MFSHDSLTRAIIGTARLVHNLLGPGHLGHIDLASSPQEVGWIRDFGAARVDVGREVVSKARKRRTR